DGRIWREFLAQRLGAALQCARWQPAGCNAVTALRHIRNGSAAAHRERAGGRRGRRRLRRHPGFCARIPRRALRGRSARRSRADPRCAPPGALGGSTGAGNRAGDRALGSLRERAAGCVMEDPPGVVADAPTPRLRGVEHTQIGSLAPGQEGMPRVIITRRRALALGFFVVSVVAFLYFVLPKLTGLGRTWDRLDKGAPGWLAVAAAFELLSFAGYVALF